MHKETCTGDIPDAWRLHGTGLKEASAHDGERTRLPVNRYQILMNVRNRFAKLDDSLHSAKVWLDVSSPDPISGRPLSDRQKRHEDLFRKSSPLSWQNPTPAVKVRTRQLQ
ncbi:hypothetical protein [Pseudomonas gingeri]|uniref:Uncharacterized protein n=2 Tax=Pseudomonas gingeri TaxID=117681 RepID=A0A7Y7XVI7_9PSED|nr:hypothetical protein [Pseudomonas gingeri]NWC13059.1 hypothetical protein [Pseudomonas gingeri]